MKRVLVTGAAGFIGSWLGERLLSRGDVVLGMDAMVDNYDPAIKRRNLAAALASDRFRLEEADICDEARIRAAFEAFRPDAVVHLATMKEDPDAFFDVSIRGTFNVLEAARVAKAKGMQTIAMTGYDGGALKEMVDIHLHVPCDCMAQVEDAHLILEHALVEILKETLHNAPKA